MAKGSVITGADLPPTVKPENDESWIRVPPLASMEGAERIIILDTLRRLKGNKSRAAEILGVGRKTLHRKLAEWGELGTGENGEAEPPPPDAP
jgi:DNA-binding NtrC family response regulator